MRHLHHRIAQSWGALLFLLLLPGASNMAAQRPPAAVRVDAVREEVVTDHRSVTGSLRAARRAAIASREKGIVLALQVREGEPVQQGQVIAQLDATQLQLDRLVLQAERLPFEAAVVERRSELEQAQRDLDSIQSLIAKQAANPKELDDARNTLQGASARLDSAEAQLAVRAALINKLEQRISDMSVVAPFDGTVVQRATEEGAWLAEGATVVELVSTGQLEVWLEVPEDLFSALSSSVGPIEYRVGSNERAFALEHYVAIPDVEQRGRAFLLVGPVRAQVNLAAGMSVVAKVPTALRSKQLTLHRDAIMRSNVGSFVYAVIPGVEGQPASAAPVDVRVLFQTAERAVVDAPGLHAGMQVVIEGNERLYPMAPILPGGGEQARRE